MASWKLIVEDYGKIKKAEIRMAPLMLFVGDNNSGKSYLMSLLWGIQNMEIHDLIGFHDEIEEKKFDALSRWFQVQMDFARSEGSRKVSLGEIQELLLSILNDGLEKNKDRLIRRIFNSQDVKIGRLSVVFENLESSTFTFLYDIKKEGVETSYADQGINLHFAEDLKKPPEDPETFYWILMAAIYQSILGTQVVNKEDKSIYLPSARTGFMLTKDIINRVGRESTFNISEEKKQIAPFTRPINQFLNVMGELSEESKGIDRLQEIAAEIEEKMAGGTLEISSMPNHEVRYVPKGKKKGMPLRVVSAVVTELSPFLLLLRHREKIQSLFYEEPEMCLHPQLQQKMGKILGELVNAGIGMIVTTHSDIILQHVNNMIKLSGRPDYEGICQKLGYTKDDMLLPEQVRVYQLHVNAKQQTEVEELLCGKDGFIVPTFNNALNRIMDEAYEIQG